MEVADDRTSSLCARDADEDGRLDVEGRGSLLEARDAEDNVRGRCCDIVFVLVVDALVSSRLGKGAVVDGSVRVRRGASVPSGALLRETEGFVGDSSEFPCGSRAGERTFLGFVVFFGGEADDTARRLAGDEGVEVFRTGDLTEAVLRENADPAVAFSREQAFC